MKGISKKLERAFSAITFAEAGEFDTAVELLSEGKDEMTEAGKKQGQIKFSEPLTES